MSDRQERRARVARLKTETAEERGQRHARAAAERQAAAAHRARMAAEHARAEAARAEAIRSRRFDRPRPVRAAGSDIDIRPGYGGRMGSFLAIAAALAYAEDQR